LQPAKDSLPGGGEFQERTFTTAHTGELEFVSEFVARENPFRYRTIFLARSKEDSAVTLDNLSQGIFHKCYPLLPEELFVTIEETCSILISYIFDWRWLVLYDEPSNEPPPPTKYSSTEYSYRLVNMEVATEPSIRAILRIGYQRGTSDAKSFLVAMGAIRGSVPWCDIFIQSQFDSCEDNGLAEAVELQENEASIDSANAQSEQADYENWEAIIREFDEEQNNQLVTSYTSPLHMFQGTSDRVVAHLPGLAFTASARRAIIVSRPSTLVISKLNWT
jgi:hypothetical protein